MPVTSAIVGFVVGILYLRVGGSSADVVPLAVLTAGGCLAYYLSLAVAVQVIHHELRIVGTGTDILAQVEAPHQDTLFLVAVYIDVAAVAGMRVVMRVAGVPFQDYLIVTVTVHVACRTVVGGVGVGIAIGRHVVRGTYEGHGEIGLVPGRHLVAGLHDDTVHHRLYGVAVLRCAERVGVVRYGRQTLGYRVAVAQQRKRGAGSIRSQEAPADEDTFLCRHGHDTA